MFYILAGNLEQAEAYALFRRMRRHEYTVISDVKVMRALIKVTLTAVGTWFEREDILKIESEALKRQIAVREDKAWWASAKMIKNCGKTPAVH